VGIAAGGGLRSPGDVVVVLVIYGKMNARNVEASAS
jgi:hypothetical protein